MDLVVSSTLALEAEPGTAYPARSGRLRCRGVLKGLNLMF